MKYIGIKQVLKSIKEDKAKKVYIAEDAEKRVTEEAIKLCNAKGIEINYVKTMQELGKLAQIDVKASTMSIE